MRSQTFLAHIGCERGDHLGRDDIHRNITKPRRLEDFCKLLIEDEGLRLGCLGVFHERDEVPLDEGAEGRHRRMERVGQPARVQYSSSTPIRFARLRGGCLPSMIFGKGGRGV